MILLWGLHEDPCLAAVSAALLDRGAPQLFVDQREPAPEFEMASNGTWTGHVAGHALDTFQSAYLRPYDAARLPEHRESPARQCRHRRLTEALSAWLETADMPVVGRLSTQLSNTSKLFQLQVITAAGFDVPACLATTTPGRVADFEATHGDVVYKSLSSVRSVVSRLGADQHDRLSDVVNCPTLFQEYVAGLDYRVHVVGRRVVGSLVVSDADDYRYDAGSQVVSVDIPTEIASRCLALSRALDLDVCGIDLRRTPGGRWVCFEVNPSPGFPYFDRGHRPGIVDSIADLLIGGH